MKWKKDRGARPGAASKRRPLSERVSPFYALLFHAIEMIDECCCTMHWPIMMADCLAAKKVVIYGCLTLLFTPDCD